MVIRAVGIRGAAIEVRLQAENPQAGFRPSTGIITGLRWPKQARIDSWIETGTEVSAHYDPMLAKIIVHGQDRAAALASMRQALRDTALYGIESNLDYLAAVVASPEFFQGHVSTNVLKTGSE